MNLVELVAWPQGERTTIKYGWVCNVMLLFAQLQVGGHLYWPGAKGRAISNINQGRI